MEPQELNLYLVDDNRSSVNALKHYLTEHFENQLATSTFFDGESCIQNINEKTDMVILDYFFNGINGNEIMRTIKRINPQIEVIMLSGNADLETAIESYKLGAKNYIVKGKKALRKISILIWSNLDQPLSVIGKIDLYKFGSMIIESLLSIGVTLNLIFNNNILNKWKLQKR